MKKYDNFKTPLGQTAWSYFQIWRRQQKRTVSNKEGFIRSRYFNSFFLFADHVKKLEFPDVEIFIRLMIHKQYPPTMWNSDDVYAEYLEQLDRIVTPKVQLNISMRTLMCAADKCQVDVKEVFTVLHATEVVNLIRKRKLSPWFLLRSKQFSSFYTNKMSTEQKQIVNVVVRYDYWKKKMGEHKEEIQEIDKIIAELGL